MRFMIFLTFLFPIMSWANPKWNLLLEEKAANSRQAIIVTPSSGVRVDVRLFEKTNGRWIQQARYLGVIGHRGFAPEGQKREGDRKTPTGTYGFMTAWGYGANPGTRFHYRVVDDQDLFIDDPTHPDYNLWVRAPTTAKSFEKMKRSDSLYEFGLVLDYNTGPVVPGHGSAIFFHVWRNSNEGTEGCIAVARENAVRVLRWVDPAKNPKILLNPNLE